MVSSFLPISTSTWTLQERFLAVPNLIICETGVATTYPEGAAELEVDLWNKAVLKKKQALEEEGKLELQLKEEKGSDSRTRYGLYARKPGDAAFKGSMVAGTQYRFLEFNAKDQVLTVEKVIFSEIEAIKSDEYRALFKDKGLPLPIGPIAPVLAIITADGYLACSVRGSSTPKYPGAIWGFGGDIDNPNITVGDHIEKVEKKEELASFRGISPQYLALGLVFDRVLMKHDMPILAQYPVPFSMITKGDKYLPDVENVTPISARTEDLERFIVDNYVDTLLPDSPAWIRKPNAGWSGDLFRVGQFLYGDSWAQNVLDKLPGGQNKYVEAKVTVEKAN
jgi:hypothetical protein